MLVTDPKKIAQGQKSKRGKTIKPNIYMQNRSKN